MAKISVIIPFKNSDADIKKVVYSVLNQNFQDFHLLIVTDEDINIPFNNKISIIKLNNEYNTSQLLNIGIKQSNSDYICFLGPNDLLLYDALKLRYEEFQRNKSLIACYAFGIDTDFDYQIKQNQNYEYFTQKNVNLPENNIKAVLSGAINLSVSSFMIKKEVFKNIEFNPLLKTTYVWDFIIRLFNNYEGEICQIFDPVYISSEEEYNIRQNNQKYFIEYLKESNYILDNFFNNLELTDKFKDLNLQCFKNLYSYMFFILVEYFPYNFWLRFYLLVSYLKKNKQFDNKLMDFWFIGILINSLTVAKKNFLTKKFA
ncbi:MAG: glycosyltransferase family 2 protein [Candidatus Gastranaerophilales bacterium]|nr:glycosyltransferase family 2 protein [Candidatus Gastranaerophilales bacterium]